MMPKIEVDYDKCTEPFDCKVCLQSCPEAVFMIKPTEVNSYEETKSEDYKLLPVWRDKCVACMDCMDECPNDALEVKV